MEGREWKVAFKERHFASGRSRGNVKVAIARL